jgi:predicted nucleotidyltransferase
MSENLPALLDRVVAELRRELGDNLYSCCVYGSAVRGNAIPGVSDINLLIVLQRSDVAGHQAVAKALDCFAEIDPFVLARRGFERSVRAFAPKFASIRRHYKVLHGADPLVTLDVDEPMRRFLCEQAVRNLRLRMVYAFVTRARNHGYGRFLFANITPLFIHFSEVLRLSGISLPDDHAARVPVFEQEFRVDGAVLRELLALKQAPRKLSAAAEGAWHERLFPIVDAVLLWIETRWPA